MFRSLQLIHDGNGSTEICTSFGHSDHIEKQRIKTSCLGHELDN